MTEQEFLESGTASWSRLRALVEKARTDGTGKLGPEDLIALHDGYRRAAADLAYAQTHFPDSLTLAELNALVGAAHGFLYAAPPHRLSRIVRFYSSDIPILVRQRIVVVALAAALLGGATLAGAAAAAVDPALGRALMPAQYRDAVGERLLSRSEGADIPGQLGPFISTNIMINNLQVSFVAFAGGITAGLLTVYVLITNGLLLGALTGLFGQAGLAIPFLALIVPHGALELPAIALAAAAGLIIAKAIIDPGDRLRRQTLREAANVAVKLLLATVPLFAIAALIEGFITPMEAPASAKLAFGGVVFVLLVLWLSLGGRGAQPATDGPAP